MDRPHWSLRKGNPLSMPNLARVRQIDGLKLPLKLVDDVAVQRRIGRPVHARVISALVASHWRRQASSYPVTNDHLSFLSPASEFERFISPPKANRQLRE
jgi:hypothetical protein